MSTGVNHRRGARVKQPTGLRRASGYKALIREVCMGMGYCGSVVDDQPLHVDMFIPESGPVSADQFVDWLYEAEGLTGRAEAHRNALRAAFVRHMGSDVIDARQLKWDVG